MRKIIFLLALFIISAPSIVSAQACGRADSNGIYTKGFCSDSLGIHWDECAGKDYVIEYICSAENKCIATFSSDCNAGVQGTGFVCVDGACVKKTCAMSGDPMNPTCTDNSGSYQQACQSSTSVKTWSCSNYECALTVTNCITGTGNPEIDEVCADGLCVKEDTIYVCASGEKKCVGNDQQECAADRKSWVTKESCTNGCENGACKSASKICTAGEKRCEGSELQTCSSDETKWEKVQTCKYGCQNRACKSAPSQEQGGQEESGDSGASSSGSGTSSSNQSASEGAGGAECTESWECSEWTGCVNNKQIRACIDKNQCGASANKPSEQKACESPSTELISPPVLIIGAITAAGAAAGIYLSLKQRAKKK